MSRNQKAISKAASEDLRINDEEHEQRLLLGFDPYLLSCVSGYLLNVFTSTDPAEAAATKILRETVLHLEHVYPELEKLSESTKSKYPYERYPSPNRVDVKDWERVQNILKKHRDIHAGHVPPINVQNMQRLLKAVGASCAERDAIQCVQVVHESKDFDLFMRMVTNSYAHDSFLAFMRRMLEKQYSLADLKKAFGPASTLYKCGIIEDFCGDWDEDSPAESRGIPSIQLNVRDILSRPNFRVEQLSELLIGKPKTTHLEIEDFRYNGLQVEIPEMVTKLQAALNGKVKGINFLLIGPPGAGKTEAAKLIAGEAGARFYPVGEDDSLEIDTRAPATWKQRMGEIRQAEAFLAGGTMSVLGIDEPEDLFAQVADSKGKRNVAGSKLSINRLLEDNIVPRIWTANAGEYDEAFLDRFTHVVHFGVSPVLVRHKIWQSAAKKEKVDLAQAKLSDDDLLYLARKYVVFPRAMRNALKNVNLCRGGLPVVERNLRGIAKLKGGTSFSIETEQSLRREFSSALYNISSNGQPVKLEKELKFLTGIEMDEGHAPSVVVRGPRGFGGMSLATYWAEKMGKNPFVIPANLIKDQHVTEIFEQAHDDNRLVIFKDMQSWEAQAEKGSAKWNDSRFDALHQGFTRYSVPSISIFYTGKDSTFDFPEKIRALFTHDYEAKALTEQQARKAWKAFFPDVARPPDEEIINTVPAHFAYAQRRVQRTGRSSQSDILDAIKLAKSLNANESAVVGFGVPDAFPE